MLLGKLRAGQHIHTPTYLDCMQPCIMCLRGAAGLETFGIKLAEAAKLFGKKFASGASITKNPMEKDQIEVGLHWVCTGIFYDVYLDCTLRTGNDVPFCKDEYQFPGHALVRLSEQGMAVLSQAVRNVLASVHEAAGRLLYHCARGHVAAGAR